MLYLPGWLHSALALALIATPGLLWIAFCLWAVNWKRLSAVLREGGWMPAVLLLVLVALVWSQIAPRTATVLGFVTVPNFWWQFGAVALAAAVGLCAGWVQMHWKLSPHEIALEPPVHAHGHDDHHGHGHGHEPVHAATPSATHTEEKFQDTGGGD